MVTPAAVRAQGEVEEACPTGRISHVFIDNHDIFDLEQLEQGTAVRWAYNLANALHVRTTEGFIRRELLFKVGECLDPLLLEESGRILRQYGFIARADIFSVAQPDGTHHVVVDTQDEWTTKVDFGPSFDDGIQIEVLDVTEENLLGNGILAGAFLRRRRERRDAGLLLQLPRVAGSRTDVNFGLGRTRRGNFFTQGVEYPFVGEVGRFALRQIFVRRDELFAYATGGAEPFTHALLDYVDERAEFSVAARVGRPGRLTLFGLGVSRERLELSGFPAGLEVAFDNDFDNPEEAPSGVSDLLAPQARASSVGRINLMFGQRNVRYVQARGLDNLNGVQDVRLGTDVGLTVGRSLAALSGEGPAFEPHYHLRLRAFAGTAMGSSFLFANGGFEGRRILEDGPGAPGGWHDVILEGDLYAYLRRGADTRHTVFARLSATRGRSMTTPYQLTLGGRAALRGFHEEEFPGGSRVLATVEDRIRLPSPQLMDLGLTLFAEAGRMWAGQVPWGADTPWKGSLGVGLRFGFPAGSRAVSRVDLALPLGGDGSPVLRVTAFEFLGLMGGFEDPQLLRSRRLNAGPDHFVTESR